MFEYEGLKKYIDCNDMIYIDTCSLGKKGIRKFYNNIKNILVNSGKKIIIKEQVYDEVKNKIKDSKDAARADKYLGKFLLEDLAIIKKAEGYEIPHADHGIKVDFNKYYTKNKMLLITNDYDLAVDVLSINNQKSVKSKFIIEVVKITEDGNLEPYNNEEYNSCFDFIKGNNYRINRKNIKKEKHKLKLEDILIDDDDIYSFERKRGEIYSFERAIRNIYRW